MPRNREAAIAALRAYGETAGPDHVHLPAALQALDLVVDVLGLFPPADVEFILRTAKLHDGLERGAQAGGAQPAGRQAMDGARAGGVAGPSVGPSSA